MTGVLGIAQLTVGIALGYTIATWHARLRAAAAEADILREARTGIHQIETHLKEAADQ